MQTTLSEVRSAQRGLDGLVSRIGVRANQLAGEGRSAPADETSRGNGDVGSGQARREAARAKTAGEQPLFGDAMSNGSLSGEHADSIARHTAKLSETGMGRFTGGLDPERYELLINAIEQHMNSLAAAADEPVAKNANLAAQALAGLVSGSGVERSGLPSITVIVDHDTMMHGPHVGSIRETETGHDLGGESIARLCCDAVIRKVTLDKRGVPINVGRKYRTATDAQWAAIKAMHSTCAWDGCDAPINWCQAHHIQEWDHGGPTNLNNLVPLCTTHHHRVHEGHWQIKLTPDRSLKIHKSCGTHHTTVPTPQRC